METITIPKEKFEKMEAELNELRELVKDKSLEEDELLNQVKDSLEDLKHGRITRVA